MSDHPGEEGLRFGTRTRPGQPIIGLADMMSMSSRLLAPTWRNEVLLVALDDHWRSQPLVTIVTESPSVPELLELFLTWAAPSGQRIPELLAMRRLICVSSLVPFLIDPGFDWCECDAWATRAGVQLVEWVALAPHSTVLPRVMAEASTRWPVVG
jgi:hypothetical protein